MGIKTCFITLKCGLDVSPRHSVRCTHASVFNFANDATSKSNKCLNLTLATPVMPDSSWLAGPSPHGWYATGGCPQEELSADSPQSQRLGGWWVTWWERLRTASYVRQNAVAWPQTSVAQGQKVCGQQNVVINLFFTLLLLFLYACVCVWACVCGRCAITVSSLNPRISSNWDARAKHWRLL